jgi:phage shock protein A
MDVKTVTTNDVALRLLELEQRFKSYCTLHEEELREIRATLSQLRKDILELHREMEADQPKVVPDENISREDVPESSSVLTL